MGAKKISDATYIVVLLLGYIAACVEMDIYFPALPRMLEFFSTSESSLQLILGFNLLGVSLGGLIVGPLSDAYGRRPILLSCTVLFLIGSLGCILSTSIEWMFVYRFVQGLGCSAPWILGVALMFDRFGEQGARRSLSIIDTVITFLCTVAPIIGAWLVQRYDWQAPFICIALMVFAYFFVLLFRLPEPHPLSKRIPFSLPQMISSYSTIFSDRAFMLTTIMAGIIFGVGLGCIAMLPLIYQNGLGVSSSIAAWCMTAVLGSYLISSAWFAHAGTWLGKKWHTRLVMYLAFAGVILMLFVSLFAADSYVLYTIALMILVFSEAHLIKIFTVEAVARFPDNRGVASSVLFFVKMPMAALFTWFAGVVYDGSFLPLSLLTFLCVLSIFILLVSRSAIEKKALGPPVAVS